MGCYFLSQDEEEVTWKPRKEDSEWSGLLFPSPGALPDPGIEPSSSARQVDSLPLSHLGSLKLWYNITTRILTEIRYTDLFQISPILLILLRAMAPHSSTLAWKIPWTEKPGRLQSVGSRRSDTTERLHFHFSLSCIGEGNGNPLQCSCLENPRDGGAWWAAVYGVAQSRTRLKRLSSSSSSFIRCVGLCIHHTHSQDIEVNQHKALVAFITT